jgi:SAM-dependent methyltransferase
MVRLSRIKYPLATILQADFEKPIAFPDSFDAVMIFNTFPHFLDEESLFSRSHSCLKPGGRLFICHSLNREALNEHHRLAGMAVAEDVLISDARMRDLYTQAGFISIRVENTDIFYSEGTK